jgi:hypothetical protein
MGFLYVDGHVRAYHGHRAIASRAYVPRRHLAMPASTDYWINEGGGGFYREREITEKSGF